MENLTLVKIFSSRNEAELAKSILSAHAIYSLIQSDDQGGMMPSFSFTNGVQLFVNKKDIEKAKKLLG